LRKSDARLTCRWSRPGPAALQDSTAFAFVFGLEARYTLHVRGARYSSGAFGSHYGFEDDQAPAANMDELVFATAKELATAVRQRQVSAIEVLEAHLAHIARHNTGIERPAAGCSRPLGGCTWVEREGKRKGRSEHLSRRHAPCGRKSPLGSPSVTVEETKRANGRKTWYLGIHRQ
jgi:hypothetical protein